MHQYHLGTEEGEKDGEYVTSKVFYQHQQIKFGEEGDQYIPEITQAMFKSRPRTRITSRTSGNTRPYFLCKSKFTYHLPQKFSTCCFTLL